MKKSILATLMFVPLIGCAQVPPPMASTTGNQMARAVVIEVQPIYESIVVGQNCQPAYVQQAPQANVGGAIVGAVIGGAIGSRFGGGNGNRLMTAAGAATGAVIGGQPQGGQVQQTVRCTPILQQRQTANAYIAEFNGMRFSGSTYRPLRVGDVVAVNVTTVLNPGE